MISTHDLILKNLKKIKTWKAWKTFYQTDCQNRCGN